MYATKLKQNWVLCCNIFSAFPPGKWQWHEKVFKHCATFSPLFVSEIKRKKKQTAPDRFPYSKAQPHFHVTFCRKCFKSEIFLFYFILFHGYYQY